MDDLSAATEPSEPRPPSRDQRGDAPLPSLGEFRLVRPLGEGPRGPVWGALHGLELPVAVEVLTSESLLSPAGRTVLRNELRSVARLHHPHLVTVLDLGEVPPDVAAAIGVPAGAPYLVTEYVLGGSLAEVGGGWSWPAVRLLLTQALDALAHAHARGLLHLGLEPAAIHLCAPGDLLGGFKIGGFGLHGLTPTDPAFLAPEQHPDETEDPLDAPTESGFRSGSTLRNLGPWTDLYALGCLAWWAVTGRSPFSHALGREAEAHRGERPPDFVPARAGSDDGGGGFEPRSQVPPGLEHWLRTLLYKAPETRFTTVADAQAAFARLEPDLDVLDDSAEPIEAEPAPPPCDVPEPPGVGEPPRDELAPSTVASLPEDWRPRVAPRNHPRRRLASLGLLTVREIPLFGRERQRDLLWKGLRGVHEEGRPRVVLIRGPSGVGKSRLVEWVAHRANELGGVRTLWIQGDDLAGAVVAHFGLQRLSAQERVRQVVERLGPIERSAPAATGGSATDSLARVLIDGLSPESEEGGPEPDGWRAALRKIVEIEAFERPVMLVVDDAHEADEALELARDLATPSDRVRRAVLVVLIAREDDGLAERPEVENRIAAVLQVARAKIVHLEPLEPSARKGLYGWLGLADPLAARVDERSRGNPQFAIQLVEDWVTRGLLTAGPDGLGLPDGQEPPMPDDLHQVWSARILQILQTLPGIAAIHLERAAALGLEVDDGEWNVACDDPAHGRVSEAGLRLRAQLVARLRDARLVVEVPRGFRFAHPMMRECVERISRKAGRWVGHHQACATLLDNGERPDPARVGVHWLEAGQPLQAIDPLFAGIERAMRRSGVAQVSAALLPLERALREGNVPEDDLRWARLYSRQATVLRRRGMLIAAHDLADKARALADRPGAETVWSECTRELARVLHERGEVPASLALLQQTAARLLRASARGSELAIVLVRMAVLARMMHQLDDAERWATQSHGILARAEIEDPALEGFVIGELAVIACRRGRMDRAFELFDEALPLLRKAGSTNRLAEVENNRGDALKRAGRWDEAEAAFLEAIRLQELIGGLPEIPKLNLAMCRLHAGRPVEARAVADEVVRTAATRVNAMMGVLARSVAEVAAGDTSAVTRELPPALDTLRNARVVDPDAAWLAEHGANLAQAMGAPDERALFGTYALEQYDALGDPEGFGRVEALLAT